MAIAARWARRQGDLLVAWEPVNGALAERLAAAQAPLRTPTFTVFRRPAVTVVLHRVTADALDNDLGELVAGELVRPGVVGGDAAFERCFAGVVESTAATPHAAWSRFYANTLTALRRDADERPPDGPVATFRAIYRHAEGLVRGRSVLDVGSCFAFFGLLLAARGFEVTASDGDAATVALGRRMAGELGPSVRFAVADALRPLPFAAGSFDTVTALHLLEHLPAAQSGAVLARLCRAARRRVVVAVPLEGRPDAVYGHRQAFDLDRLAALGSSVAGWRATAHELRGGWLVLERAQAAVMPPSTASTAPVMASDSRPHSHASTPATSSGSISR